MLHIIANQYTLTEYLLDSLPAQQRAQTVHMHPRRIKGFAYSILKAMLIKVHRCRFSNVIRR